MTIARNSIGGHCPSAIKASPVSSYIAHGHDTHIHAREDLGLCWAHDVWNQTVFSAHFSKFGSPKVNHLMV